MLETILPLLAMAVFLAITILVIHLALKDR